MNVCIQENEVDLFPLKGLCLYIFNQFFRGEVIVLLGLAKVGKRYEDEKQPYK